MRHREIHCPGRTGWLRRPPVCTVLSCLFICAALAAPVVASPADVSRGQLLYSTHCIECHTTQMHWRARRQVRDWESLKAQVRRWQGEARLQWTEQDIDAVARHLNATIYRLPGQEQIGRVDRP